MIDAPDLLGITGPSSFIASSFFAEWNNLLMISSIIISVLLKTLNRRHFLAFDLLLIAVRFFTLRWPIYLLDHSSSVITPSDSSVLPPFTIDDKESVWMVPRGTARSLPLIYFCCHSIDSSLIIGTHWLSYRFVLFATTIGHCILAFPIFLSAQTCHFVLSFRDTALLLFSSLYFICVHWIRHTGHSVALLSRCYW